MIRSVAQHRWMGRWLVGLYVLAIAGGFLPLVESYSGHGVASAIAHIARDGGAPEHHHLGDADDAAHHHVLQDLTGAPASLLATCDVPIAHVVNMPAAPPALRAADAVRLDRPPKILLSI